MKIYIFLFLILTATSLQAQISSQQNLFKNHQDGYPVFRIPTVVVTKSGKILAFCEGRKSLMDHGDIDLVMKTSTNNGLTWSNLQVVWNHEHHTCGNPAPVVDQVTGDVMIVTTLNNDRVFVLRSTNEGITWENPVDITPSVKPNTWKWYATGPVHGIQLEQSFHKNRLIIPCNHTLAGIGNHISHIIYSDDHGQTWQLGGSVPQDKTDECTVAELSNGNLLLNMRNNHRTLPNRKTSLSTDGGLTWTNPVYDSTLVEPVCQGSLLRYSFTPDILLFANPQHTTKRKNLTLYISRNNGKSWPQQIILYAKQAAYNDLAVLPNGDLICVFETGKIWPYSGIVTIIVSKSLILE